MTKWPRTAVQRRGVPHCSAGRGGGVKKTSERGRIFLLLLEPAAHFIQRARDLLPATSPNGVRTSRKERTSLSSSSTRVLEMPAAIENQLPSLTRQSRLDFPPLAAVLYIRARGACATNVDLARQQLDHRDFIRRDDKENAIIHTDCERQF